MWTLRERKLHSKRVLKRVQKAQHCELLAAYFQTWCSWRRLTSTDHLDEAWNYRTTLSACRVRCTAQLHALDRDLRQAIKEGKNNYVKTHVEALRPHASASEILHTLRPVMGSSNQRKRKGASLPYVLKEDGEPCGTVRALTDRWIEFFGDMEGGTRMDAGRQRELWREGLRAAIADELDLSVAELPSLFDLEAAFRHVKPGKATGHDAVPGELCHRFSSALANAAYPQLMKLFLHGQEALVHKGGKLVTAYKKGRRELCASYRSLLISSHVGKSLHRTLRQSQNQLYAAYMQEQQLGGRQRTPVAFAGHMCKAFQRLQRRKGHSCGFLFLDLTEAYYRVLRPLALGGPWDDEVVIRMARRLKLGPEAVHDLYKHLRAPHALDRAHLPQHHQRYLRALHRDTYFYMDQQTDVCRTEIGSRPGDSFADVVFGYLWSRLLRSLEQDLVDLGVAAEIPTLLHSGLSSTPQETTQSFLGPTWCDDLSIACEAITPRALTSKICTIASCLLDACEGLAMTPNLSPGKTEALLCFTGPGSRAEKRRHFAVDNGGWLDVVCNYKTVRVHVTGEYQHLGGLLHHQGDQRKEARRRLAIGHNSFTQHRKLLLKNPALSLERRTQLFQSLILSQVTYGMESWLLRTRRDQEHLHNSLIKLYRRLLDHRQDDHVTDDDILSELMMVSPTVLLRTIRLRYLGLLYGQAGLDLWSLIVQDEEWVQLVRADLQWMYQQLWNCSSLPDPKEQLEQWEYTIRHYPGYWKRLVRRAGMHSAMQKAIHHGVLQSHRSIAATLEQHGHLRRPDVGAVPPQPDQEVYGCLMCGIRCCNKAGEGAHMFKVHGQYNAVRTLYDATTCGHCLKCYHTPARLGAHLKSSGECRQHLLGAGYFVRPIPGAGSKHQREWEKKHDGLLPHQQCAGPRREGQRGEEFPHFDVTLFQALAEYLTDTAATSTEQVVSEMQDLIRKLPVSWTICRTTLTKLRDEMRAEYFEDMEIDFAEATSALHQLLRPDAWQLRGQTQEADQTQDLNYWERVFQAECPWRRTTTIPRAFSKDRYILHAFSGRRRVGDFEYFFKQITIQDGVVAHVVSVDIVIDKELGDLMQPSVRRFWLAAIVRGWVIGFIGGPPCETWSQARGKIIAGRRACPRVLRVEDQLWGKDSMGLREAKQVCFGNTLLLFCLESIICLVISGGFGLLEHPARPQRESLASIWKLPLMALLRSIPDVKFVDLDQGLFGAASRKPTTLLCLRLGAVDAVLQENRIRRHNPHETSIGLNSEGQFCTTALKEYPPALCKALGGLFADAVQRFPLCTDQVDHDFKNRCQAMESRDYSAFLGRDFTG